MCQLFSTRDDRRLDSFWFLYGINYWATLLSCLNYVLGAMRSQPVSILYGKHSGLRFRADCWAASSAHAATGAFTVATTM